VVLVTHDRALIDAVATRTWAIEDAAGDGDALEGGAPRVIREVLGGYTELLRVRDRERHERERAAVQPVRAARRAATSREKTPTAAALEKDIAEVEAQLETLKAQ